MDDNLKNNGGEPLENEDNAAAVENGGEIANNELSDNEAASMENSDTAPLIGASAYSSFNAAPTTPPMKPMGDDKAKKRTAAIIITACVFGVLITALGIIGIVKILNSKPDDTASSTAPDFESNGYFATSETVTGDTETTTEPALESTTEKRQTPNSGNKETTVRDVNSNTQATINELPPLTKTGDNILSDNPDNEFIKIIVKKYNVDAKNLVAIYAVPDKGNNFVLEFDGKTDSSGNVIKSPDTLKRVHQIDKERNVKTATGSVVGNVGVSYAEGKLVFYLVTNVIMPQYPDYFTGVEPLDKSKTGN